MSSGKGVLFVPYHQTLDLLTVDDAFRVCEQVYQMHADGSVVLAVPPSFKLDVAEGFNNHWHVKGAFLKDLPATGIRLLQWTGRAIRNEDDQARVVCYDRRLLRTGFGRRMLQGLPPYALSRRVGGVEVVHNQATD